VSLVTALCIGLSAFQLIVTYAVVLDPLLHFAIFLSLSSALIFLTDAEATATSEAGRMASRWLLWLCAAATLSAGLVFVARFESIMNRWPVVDPLGPLEIACAAVLVLAVIETTRRSVGIVLVGVMAAFLAYALAGHLLPGLLYHRPLSIAEILDQLVFTSNGIFGAPLEVAATYVYIFVLFGTALELSGGGDFMFRVARAIAGRAIGGPAKVAVVGSALYGSISGSPTSNVMTTGLFTIPLMRRSGMRADVAGGIEAVAATGGALLPPVMGSAAFLMAELTGISYFQICVAAITPALLFYGCLFMQVHFGAAQLGIRPLVDDVVPVSTVVREGGHHLIPLVTLVVLLALGQPPLTAAGVATLLTVVVSWRHRHTRIGWRELLKLLDLSARRSLLVTAACAAAGVVVGALVVTGVAGKVTSMIFAAASGSVLLALVATMVVCTILGMGMPVPSAYIITAVVAGPPLAALGLTPMAANLFILYYASLSAITPPVAVAAFAAASIAEVNPTRVGLQACRLGIVAFVIPFFFVYRPELLLNGSPAAVIEAVAASALGALLIAGALAGFVRDRLRNWERVVLLAAGLALIAPGLLTDALGAIVGLAILWRQLARGGAQPAAAATSDAGGTVEA
jgi:TRAP transporter 4TM/12TM fusion protein